MSSSDIDMNSIDSDTNQPPVYDPEQSLDTTRELRRKYREFEAQTQGNEIQTTERLMENVKKSDILFRQGDYHTYIRTQSRQVSFDHTVHTPSEATLDSIILHRFTTHAYQNARKLKIHSGGVHIDVNGFVSRLCVAFQRRGRQEHRLDWGNIGMKALNAARWRGVGVVGFILGPLSISQKHRSPAKRFKLEKNKADERSPEEVVSLSRETNETTRNVVIIANKLQETGSINLFRFFINPNDFAQSVENLFYLSFLIRDGKVAMNVEVDEQVTIYLCEPPNPDQYEQGGIRKKALVFEFDMETWKRAIEVYDLAGKEPMIPSRAKYRDGR
ncbi:hypothetical protein VNI00_004231 [Paramarasmius palmivorus]|uniref:Non-structural maintenance of chromosomes element 4 n=1 Tax=Paramarasmius palmivorus TaxID=297713 RepID=A0AAW0DK73_9AGAR